MEANNAHVPSNQNAAKVLNLTDYDFTTRQLLGEDTEKEVQCLPHNSYFIIKEIDWEKDAHIAKFITRFILENEVKSRLMLPEYIVLEVPVEHRHIVEETLKGTNVKVLYVKTEQVELENGGFLDVRSIEHAWEKAEPKIILNLTNLDFTDRQIRDIYDKNYEIHYPENMMSIDWDDETVGIPSLFNTCAMVIQNKINKMSHNPDCVIVDVPEEVIPYISEKFRDSGIRFIYTRTVFVELAEGDPLKVKLLSRIEE